MYLDPPTVEEGGEVCPDELPADADAPVPKVPHKWDRVITGNFHVTKGPGWKGAKGYWSKV